MLPRMVQEVEREKVDAREIRQVGVIIDGGRATEGECKGGNGMCVRACEGVTEAAMCV